MHRTPKKLVLVLATSVLVTDNRGEEIVLEKVPCIYYPVRFQENQGKEGQE